MTRIEIFTNRSVEENLVEAFQNRDVAKTYSKVPIVHGVGSSGPRMGDAIWPEENVAFIIWCDEDEAESIKQAVDEVKSQFPGEGIKFFSMERDSGGGELRYADRAEHSALEGPEERAALPAPEKPVPVSFGGETV
ncbi:MAG: hypothetical protein LBK61_04690 [Spirochaetaceae bacterium]|jgi:hypothetical protein|nr:hypothetical protein [Spirochaetaceae bacterium]